MNKMTSEEVAWLVGIFDGEGCVSIKESNSGRRIYVVTKVKMCDFDVIRNLQRVTGIDGFLTETKSVGNHSASLAWSVSVQEDVVDLLTIMKDFPLLSLRRKFKMEEALIIARSNAERKIGKRSIQNSRFFERQSKGFPEPSCVKHEDAFFSIDKNLNTQCNSCMNEWRRARKNRVS